MLHERSDETMKKSVHVLKTKSNGIAMQKKVFEVLWLLDLNLSPLLFLLLVFTLCSQGTITKRLSMKEV